MSRNKKKMIWGVALLVSAVMLTQLAAHFPLQTEEWYSKGLFRWMSWVMIRITSAVPFSITEVVIVLGVLGGVFWLGRLAFRCFSRPAVRRELFRHTIASLVLVGGGVYFVFVVCGGLNYYRLPFAAYSGLELRPSSAQELLGLGEELVDKANALATQVQRNEDGTMALAQPFTATAKTASAAFGALCRQYPGIFENSRAALPKPMFFSRVMSYSRITGGYFFFTFEANINVDTPHYSIPATMTHELAHVCGFMREDEANYLAYLSCMASPSADLQYSGALLGLSNTLNALYPVLEPEAYSQLTRKISPSVWHDFKASDTYWAKYETKYGDFSEKVNDVYLKSNAQQDGLQSYGRMVDLMLAEYRQRMGR